MNADEPIKGLMTKTLNLMIEAEFGAKIGAKKSEQTPDRMGVEGISRGQVSRITSSINEFVENFRSRSLKDVQFPGYSLTQFLRKCELRVTQHSPQS